MSKDVYNLEGREHTETGQPTTPQVVEQVKQILQTYPEAKQTIYLWLNMQRPSLRLSV